MRFFFPPMLIFRTYLYKLSVRAVTNLLSVFAALAEKVNLLLYPMSEIMKMTM